MNWTKFFLLYLRNVALATLGGGAILGLAGFLLAGKEGAVNMAYWGLVLGFAFGLPSGLLMFQAKFWGDYAGRYGRWWFKKESEGEHPERISETYDRWPK